MTTTIGIFTQNLTDEMRENSTSYLLMIQKKKEFVTRPDSIVFCAERWRDKFIYNTEGNEKDIGKSMGMITFRNKTAHQFLIRETIFSLLKK